jgi:hypothetical protein
MKKEPSKQKTLIKKSKKTKVESKSKFKDKKPTQLSGYLANAAKSIDILNTEYLFNKNVIKDTVKEHDFTFDLTNIKVIKEAAFELHISKKEGLHMSVPPKLTIDGSESIVVDGITKLMSSSKYFKDIIMQSVFNYELNKHKELTSAISVFLK